MVAVKVIEHNESVASKLEGLRESVLSANIQHPNVVSSWSALGCPCKARVQAVSAVRERPSASGSVPWQAHRNASRSLQVCSPGMPERTAAEHNMPESVWRARRPLCLPAAARDPAAAARAALLRFGMALTGTHARAAEHVQGHPARRVAEGRGRRRAGLWLQGQRERRRGAPPGRRRALRGRVLRGGAGDLDAQRVLRPRCARRPRTPQPAPARPCGCCEQQCCLSVGGRLMQRCLWLLWRSARTCHGVEGVKLCRDECS